VICCDGTDNEFGVRNTNVVRLVQVLEDAPRSPRRPHIVFYDPGVGTMPEPGVLTRIGKKTDQAIALAIATDLKEKVARAYRFLMNTWEPGDAIYMFGFSRGAYTVRVLAGLLHLVGLLPSNSDNLVAYAIRLFASLRGHGPDERKAYWNLCDAFRTTFARPTGDEAPERRPPIAFMGVWDTVSSVGWAWNPAAYPFTRTNPSVAIIRHAISLDERRAFFRPNRFEPAPNQDVAQMWFPGVHSDVGGGYADGGLWRAPFQWIATEAGTAGLAIDPVRLGSLTTLPDVGPGFWAGPMHESLRSWWWVAEVFPKLTYNPASRTRLPQIGLGRSRQILTGESLSMTVRQRIKGDITYRPPNLSAGFIERVLSGSEATADGPYTP